MGKGVVVVASFFPLLKAFSTGESRRGLHESWKILFKVLILHIRPGKALEQGSTLVPQVYPGKS